MDRWKAEQGRGREKRKIRRKKSRRERFRRKKMQMREKVGKSRFTLFFQWFVAPEGRKVGSLKRRVRSQLARWEMKNCTPLWRAAHLQAKMYKTHQFRTTFTSWDVEKVHAVVARSTFPSQNVQNTPAPDDFWKLRCRKSARRCGAKYISKSKCTKHTIVGPLLEVEMSKKCTPLWREAHFQVKMYKADTPCTDHFWRLDVVSRGRRKGFCTCSKVSKTWGFCSISKNDGRHGTFEEDLQRCIFRGRRSGNSRRYQFWKHDFQWSVCLFWPRSRVCSIWPCCYQCCRWNAGMMVFFLTHPCRVCVLHPFCLRHQSCNRRPTKENNAVGALAGIGFWSTTGDRCNGIW